MTKVIVVDDHPLVRRGLISVLESEASIEIVGEAETIEESLALLQSAQPDLALVDLRLGDSSGLSLIEEAQRRKVNSKFVIVTSSSSERDFSRAEELGVSGYLLKDALPEEIINAIKIVMRGRKYYDSGVLEAKMKSSDNMISEELTPREKEVLRALGKGLTNRDIATKMYVTENTVKKHVSQIFAKLNLGDRTQAALYAYSKGLV